MSLRPDTEKPVVLVVGFRLKLFRSSPFLHWLFQRVCIVTMPFWSGFKGFHVKLWMVDKATKNYLGIYDWYGRDSAELYVLTLTRVLRPLSTAGSVWYTIETTEQFESFLSQRQLG